MKCKHDDRCNERVCPCSGPTTWRDYRDAMSPELLALLIALAVVSGFIGFAFAIVLYPGPTIACLIGVMFAAIYIDVRDRIRRDRQS